MPENYKIEVNKQILETFVQAIAEKLEKESQHIVLETKKTEVTEDLSKSPIKKTEIQDEKAENLTLKSQYSFQKTQTSIPKSPSKTIRVMQDRHSQHKFFSEQKLRY